MNGSVRARFMLGYEPLDNEVAHEVIKHFTSHASQLDSIFCCESKGKSAALA